MNDPDTRPPFAEPPGQLAEPTQDDIERAYPMWATWEGVGQMFHGRRTEGAALTAKGEDWMDLADQIRRAEAMLEDTRPAGWREPSP